MARMTGVSDLNVLLHASMKISIHFQPTYEEETYDNFQCSRNVTDFTLLNRGW